MLVAVFFMRESPVPRTKAAEVPKLSLRGFDGNFKRFLVILALFTLSNSSDSFLILRARDSGVSIVLVPLQEGTGSSVKSIEALARGAVVLSTTIGMRGIPVVAGRHCVIEDNLGAYPDRIFEIIQDTDKAASLRAAALQLGSDYDYRTVFAAYRSPDRTQGVHATPSHSPQSRETVLVRRVL